MYYQCVLCQALCLFDNIILHDCIKGYEDISFDGYTFFPVKNTDSEKTTCASTNKENTQNEKKSTGFTWTDKKVEELIENVRIRSTLWNFQIPLKERNKDKNKQWEEVCTALSGTVTVADMRTKWKNLVDVFRRQCRQDKSSKKSGSATGKKMKWPFYDSMSFMKEMDLNMQKTESNSCLTNNSSDESFDDEGHLGTKSSAKKRKSKVDMMQKMFDALAKEPDKIVLPKPQAPDEIRSVCMVLESKLRTLSAEERQNKIKEMFALFYW